MLGDSRQGLFDQLFDQGRVDAVLQDPFIGGKVDLAACLDQTKQPTAVLMAGWFAAALLAPAAKQVGSRLAANDLQTLPDAFHRIAAGSGPGGHGDAAVDVDGTEGVPGWIGVTADVKHGTPGREIVPVVVRDKDTTGEVGCAAFHAGPTLSTQATALRVRQILRS